MNVILRHRDGFALPLSFRTVGFDRAFDHLAGKLLEGFASPETTLRQPTLTTPRVTVREAEAAYEVEAELPGVSKENVIITVDGTRVSIVAEVKRESERKEGEDAVGTERVVRKFVRSFVLAAEVDDVRAVAKIENGVLTLTLPKKEEPKPRQIPVQ
jgi:HSP20 family protein